MCDSAPKPQPCKLSSPRAAAMVCRGIAGRTPCWSTQIEGQRRHYQGQATENAVYVPESVVVVVGVRSIKGVGVVEALALVATVSVLVVVVVLAVVI